MNIELLFFEKWALIIKVYLNNTKKWIKEVEHQDWCRKRCANRLSEGTLVCIAIKEGQPVGIVNYILMNI